ncbi:MarR family winged helix-turn-helix transcriptional regulator [Granulicella arctica]|uniref:DNA-binding MarR family transcriptional regulator n=1 Tax=Granulicella arctica TaxID=940613 RepID=A0A7Y9PGU0_9BACT|nr:MarR family transcriptional regulator [Granulicella arctica]NYF79484.1 DNA-binding MarR family transcriptional regulator [Granulicella arctica]
MERKTTENLQDGRGLARQRMKRILLHFRSRLDEELRPQGVTMAQLQLLYAIQSSPGSSGAQLARGCYVTPQTAQALIRRLEEDGWIERRKGNGNDRILAASLTAAGEELLQTAETIMKGTEAMLWHEIPDDDIEELNRLLGLCLKNIVEE